MDSNTLFLKNIFDELTKDVLPVRSEFKTEVILRIQLLGEFDLSTLLNNLVNSDGKTPIRSQKVQLYREFASGNLYVNEYTSSQYFTFVHNDYRTYGEEIFKRFISDRALAGHIWFSFLPKNSYIREHIDQVERRWHYVVENDPSIPSLIFSNGGKINARAGETFEFDPRIPHSVPTQSKDRLHLIASLKAP